MSNPSPDWRSWAHRVLRRNAHTAVTAVDNRRAELDRLTRWPRFIPTTTDLLGPTIEAVDAASFLWTYHEIFVNRLYEFAPIPPSPCIIDCGANIGLSVLFFKGLSADARVTAFEADPALVPVLERNLRSAGASDVRVEPYALWSSAGMMAFAADGADGGRLADLGGGHGTLRVPTVRLREYLDQPVDLLKIDIEGAETEVLLDCDGALDNVGRLYVEYHSQADRPQTLHVLLALLARNGFRVSIDTVRRSPQPFVRQEVDNGFDLQLHVFAVRAP
jgi:FkbM family methyltransferase